MTLVLDTVVLLFFGGAGVWWGMRRGPSNWKLPPEIEARLGETSYGRQRVVAEAGHLLLVLSNVPGEGRRDREPALFLRKPDGAWLANGRENGGHKLRALLAEYENILDACETAYEKADTPESVLRLLERLGSLKRASANLAATLQSARESARDDRFLIGMRDQGYEISRGFELLANDARLKLDYLVAKNSETEAGRSKEILRAQHRLNVLAAITFPIMAIATMLGMNLPNGLENSHPGVFIGVLATGLVVGILVKGWVAKGR